MLPPPLLLLLLLAPLSVLSLAGSSSLPLFDARPDPPPLQTYHTSLSTLLPLLPLLSPPPSHTLLLTLATPAFKPLLYNWLCFLRYKAKWGVSTTSTSHSNSHKKSDRGIYSDQVPKVLVVTSDEGLARELSEYGVVVWYLRSVRWEDFERDGQEEEEEEEEEERKEDWLAEVVKDDLFVNLRLLELLIPPPPSSDSTRWKKNSTNQIRTEDERIKVGQDEDLRSKMIEWGSFHYQSLMLERTLVMSVLTGALVESQRVSLEERLASEAKEQERIMAHDWNGDVPFEREEWVGVKGILVVDNDAVWLSSPSPFLTHPYRPNGPHPSILYAADMSPHSQNAWMGYSMPCACFLYTRTSDSDSSLASGLLSPDSDSNSDFNSPTTDNYYPAQMAAYVWRQISLCHISMLLSSITVARNQFNAMYLSPVGVDEGDEEFNEAAKRPNFTRARAPSFQATALGPALFLAEMGSDNLPNVDHLEWMSLIGSGEVDDLLDVLDEGELLFDVNGENGDSTRYEGGGGCLALAKRNWNVCPNLEVDLDRMDLGRWAENQRRGERGSRSKSRGVRLRTDQLPYEIFPPGNEFFEEEAVGEREEAGEGKDDEEGLERRTRGGKDGTRACVVHANYATGGEKEKLLRGRNLWALVGGEPGSEEASGGGGWRCDARVMRDA